MDDFRPLRFASASERERIVDALRSAIARHDSVSAAYVHGSFLDGAFRDVDVGLLLAGRPDAAMAFRAETVLERELSRRVHLPVDARAVNDASPAFRFSVVRQGQLMFERDERARAEFEARAMSEFWDFRYVLDEYRRVALGIGP